MVQKNEIIDFKSEIIDRKLCSITMDVEVPENIAAGEINLTFNQIRQETKIDGFRQGKVPMSIIKEKFADKAKNRAVENIIRKTVLNALEKENFAPIDSPVVEEFNYEFGQVLKYRFTAECNPEINVQNYKGINIKKRIFKVTDKNLKQSLEALRGRNAKLVPFTSNEVTEKSFVLVDYDAFDANGNALPAINEKGHMLDLDSKNIIKGLKESLKGAKINEERDVKIEYPVGYPNKTLADKTITFKMKIVEIKEKEIPELNDDFAKDMGAENLEDLKIKIKEAIETEEKRRQDMEVEKQIIDCLLKENKFAVPPSLVEAKKETLIARMKNYMKCEGAFKEYIEKQIELEQDKFSDEAEQNVRLSYILNAICETEKLVVTDSDIDAEKNKMKASSPNRENDIDRYFTKKKENIILSLKERKLFEFLLNNAKVTIEKKDIPLSMEIINEYLYNVIRRK